MKTVRKSRQTGKAVALGLTSLVLLSISTLATAQTFGDAAQRVFDQFGDFADVIMGVIFLAGLGFGFLSATKFKAHNENPQQNRITTPIVLAIVSVMCVGFPAYINMTKQTLLEDGDSNSLDAGAYQSIGN